MSLSSSKKLYYTVGDLAEEYDIEPHQIRYWCKKIPELDPDRSPGGQRQFNENDVECFKRIYHLIEEEQFTLEGAKKRLKSDKEQPDTKRLTEKIKKQCEEGLQEIQNFIESL